jgi:hypothetical protein
MLVINIRSTIGHGSWCSTKNDNIKKFRSMQEIGLFIMGAFRTHEKFLQLNENDCMELILI